MLSRRQFLQTSSMVSLAPVLPTVFASSAQAAGAASDEKVLVVLQLDGGNDGINTVVPFGDDAYPKVRDKLRLETTKLHALDDHVGLHPSMRAAKELFDDGRLAIVQGVGYPNPDRSHFRSRKIWQTGHFDEAAHAGYGWLGRALDLGMQQGNQTTGANAIFVGEQETPVALWGRRSSAISLAKTDDLMLQSGISSVPWQLNPGRENAELQQFVTEQFMTACEASESFKRQESEDLSTSDVKYPNSALGSRLELLAKILRSDSRVRVFYTIQGGYDTHSAQLYTHSQLLREFSDAVKAFLDDLRAAKLDDRVLLLAFSEFGRRVKENDSQGTDHGTAGPVFLAGPSVIPGLHGHTPDLTDLEDGDLKMQADFRGLYASILEDWLEVDSQKVLGGDFEGPPLTTTRDKS